MQKLSNSSGKAIYLQSIEEMGRYQNVSCCKCMCERYGGNSLKELIDCNIVYFTEKTKSTIGKQQYWIVSIENLVKIVVCNSFQKHLLKFCILERHILIC